MNRCGTILNVKSLQCVEYKMEILYEKIDREIYVEGKT